MVTSNPTGITCKADCAETYPNGTIVTLTGIPDATSTFTGWSGGGCSGTVPCMLTLTTDITVAATFELEASGTPTNLVAAVLPSSRSVQVGTTATAFGLLINGGTTTATSCSIAPGTSIPATFSYQITDPQTNLATGSPNTPVDIPAGASQTFIFSLTPTAEIPPTDVRLNFTCTNTAPAPSTVGLNTLLLSASTTPVPDIVALVATPTNDGVTHLPGATSGLGSTGVFVVASLNVGATGTITVTADTGTASLPLAITLCQTNTNTGVCLAPPSTTVTTDIVANTTPSFGVFVEGLGPIPFDPATNRIFIRFNDQGGITRGSTSVAVVAATAPPPPPPPSSGITLNVRPTDQEGVVEITWNVSGSVLSLGATEFGIDFFVGGPDQWFNQFVTDEPTENGIPVLLGGVPSSFCFRMTAIDSNGDFTDGPFLAQGFSGNKSPCQ